MTSPEEMRFPLPEYSVENSLGLVRCDSCGGIVEEDSPGAAMKFLGIQDCECSKEELVESLIQELQIVGAGVEKFRELFLAGHDVYSSYGSIVFGKSPAELTDEDRRRAKILLFPKLYGGSR